MAYLVVFVLDDVARVQELFDAWEAAGAPGITIIESVGLGRIRTALREDMPLVPDLSDVMAREEVHHRTVFSVVPDDATVDRLVAATERLFGNLLDEHSGFLFVLPVARAVGLRAARRR